MYIKELNKSSTVSILKIVQKNDNLGRYNIFNKTQKTTSDFDKEIQKMIGGYENA